MNSTQPNHSGNWARVVGLASALILTGLLFKGCQKWGNTPQKPEPVVVTPIKAQAPVASKDVEMTAANQNNIFTLNGTVPNDVIKSQIDFELKRIFGEGNFANNLTVDADVKHANWMDKIAGLFDRFTLPGIEASVKGDVWTLGGTAGKLKEPLQAFLGAESKVYLLNIQEAAQTATGNAHDALTNLPPDASAKEVLDALSMQIINFPSGSAAIPAENQAVLKLAAARLKQHADFKFEVSGHADNKGTPAAILDLSTKRAQSVRAFLVKNGVDAKMLSAKGYGDSMPVADNNTEIGRLKNRRIDYKTL
jgi:outer membrane protein OmpA-like peptidoglycan-associated protein